MRKLESHDWWPELVRDKDALSLRELAKKFTTLKRKEEVQPLGPCSIFDLFPLNQPQAYD